MTRYRIFAYVEFELLAPYIDAAVSDAGAIIRAMGVEQTMINISVQEKKEEDMTISDLIPDTDER